MAQLTYAQYIAKLPTVLFENTVGDIEGLDLNEVFIDSIDSFAAEDDIFDARGGIIFSNEFINNEKTINHLLNRELKEIVVLNKNGYYLDNWNYEAQEMDSNNLKIKLTKTPSESDYFKYVIY